MADKSACSRARKPLLAAELTAAPFASLFLSPLRCAISAFAVLIFAVSAAISAGAAARAASAEARYSRHWEPQPSSPVAPVPARSASAFFTRSSAWRLISSMRCVAVSRMASWAAI